MSYSRVIEHEPSVSEVAVDADGVGGFKQVEGVWVGGKQFTSECGATAVVARHQHCRHVSLGNIRTNNVLTSRNVYMLLS